MAGINKVIIMGYLGRNPELAYTQGGTAITSLAVATSRKKQDGEEITAWHRCTAWGRTAEIIAQYFEKGQMIYIEGELVYGQYEKDGQKHYTTEISVKEFAFCGAGTGSARNDGQGQPSQNYQQQAQYQNQNQNKNQSNRQNKYQPAPQHQANGNGYDHNFQANPETDIPF